uniref:mechanosensitive ion channel family protein n=1 Tax=Chelativorans sp. YIM 93263 TaxID=2906648 RepID=UPI002378B3A6|nr:mechanosensitive ion channel domain-containing protein [Chelativorans sp. YIM 93263]
MTTTEAMLHEIGEFAVNYSFAVLGAVILIIAGFIVAGILQRWTSRALSYHPAFDETLQRFLSKAVRYIVLILMGVTVLAEFGVQTASIIAAIGAAGLAIGLALQGTLQNIAAGIMLLVLRPFRVGEYITAGSISGTIQEIGLFATEMKAVDGVFIMAPNSELWNTAVTNYSRNSIRREDLAIGIGYNDDIELALGELITLAKGDDRVLSSPEPAAFVSDLGDSAVVVTLRYWTATIDWWQTQLDLRKAAKATFDAKGISIPFPQRDVHYIPDSSAQSKPAKKATTPRKTAAPR